MSVGCRTSRALRSYCTLVAAATTAFPGQKEDCLNAELGSRLRRPRTAGAGRPETLRATRDGKSEGAVARSRCACGCEIRSLLIASVSLGRLCGV